MTISAVEICNRALNAVGAPAITALTDGTERADLCNRLYADLRDELLQDHPWNFALRRASLAADATAPDWGYAYQYQMPTDCLRVIEVNSDTPEDVEWTVEGRMILTDETSPLEIRYVTKTVDEVNFPPKFVSALVLRIAVDLAMPTTESSTKREGLVKEFGFAIRSARGQDARENGPQKIGSEAIIRIGF